MKVRCGMLKDLLGEFESIQEQCLNTNMQFPLRWIAPPEGVFKINFNAVVDINGNQAGIGAVVRGFRKVFFLQDLVNELMGW